MAGTGALFESGAAIAPAILATVFGNALNGEGQHVDISLAETHAGGVDRRHATAIGFSFSGRKTLRAAGGAQGMPQGIYPCADGYVDFTNAALHPARIADMLGHADWLKDPIYQDPQARIKPDIIEAWNANFFVWCLERTKREIWAEARRASSNRFYGKRVTKICFQGCNIKCQLYCIFEIGYIIYMPNFY